MAKPCAPMEAVANTVRNSRNVTIAVCDNHEHAVLFAAAAEMRDALRDLIDAYGGDWPDWLRAELAAAENALHKAEGRS
jgi:hypothetical protein